MDDIEQAKTVLSSHGWLKLTPAEFQSSVFSRAKLCRFAKNEHIYHYGDEPGGLWGLASGAVAVDYPADFGRPTLVHIAHAGFWTGEASVITGGRRIIGLRATRDASLLHLSRSDFLAIAAVDPLAWRYLSLCVLGQSKLLLGYTQDLRIPRSEVRVIAVLLRLGGRISESDAGPDHGSSAIDLTQERLAELCNVSRARVAEILRRLVADGLVRLDYRSIAIADANGLLARMARQD